MTPRFNDTHRLALLTDLYQLTMAYGYWKSGLYDRQAIFHLYYRRPPFDGAFVLTAGLEAVIGYLQNIKFEVEDIVYLSGLKQNGKTLFDESFLNYLQRWEFQCDVDALPEGSIAFPNQPLIRIKGPLLQAQLIETALLNLTNFPTLIATKAARVVEAAQGDDVLEFGLRRAQGVDGAMTASRSAYLAGCAATSNVLAAKYYGIPVSGTQAHSWIMAFGDEEKAFAAYAQAMPHNCLFLVDTYDTIQGVKNAIKIGRWLRKRGHQLKGVRLDSGDQVSLSLAVRKLLDEAGFPEVKIIGGNDLDEYKLAEMKKAGAKIDAWGIGTRLVTAYNHPALGGVYKLSAIQDEHGNWQYRVKQSEHPAKSSYPGQLQTLRFYNKKNEPIADCTYNQLATTDLPDGPPEAVTSEALLIQVFKNGQLVRESVKLFDGKGKYYTLKEIRKNAKRQWKLFSHKKHYHYEMDEEVLKLRAALFQ